MNKIIVSLIFLLWIVSCQNQSSIIYKDTGEIIQFENTAIKLTIDQNMKISAAYFDGEKTQSIVSEQAKPNDYLVINGENVYQFPIEKKKIIEIENKFGSGKQLKLFGKAKIIMGGTTAEIEKILTIELYNNFPNAAITYVEYTNVSDSPLKIDRTISSSYTVDRKLLDNSKKSYDFSLFQGCGVTWGVDYCNIKVDSAYSATNFMGITVADRDPQGGGIPLLDLWGKEMGMAIAHISQKPEFVNLPVKTLPDGRVQYSIEEPFSQQYDKIDLAGGESYSTIKNIVVVHSLDYFDALRTYAEFLNAEGIKTFKETPATVPNAYWKTWGYEVDFKLSDIYSKVDEFRELGIEMVVLDDGWFSNYGDWEPSTEKDKFPEGRKSLHKFVTDMHKEGLKVGIWWCPLSVEPKSEVAKAHPDWFMLKKDGQPYVMRDPYIKHDPKAHFLCPDYEPVLNYWKEQIEKIYNTFDLDFVYHDWGNLIEVPPCYNPQHRHVSPLAPYWNMSKQYQQMYKDAESIKPGCAIEMCECGRPHDPYKMPYYNITNASDATSKEQVRERLKVEKALNGSKAYFNPGYILPAKLRDNWNYDPCEIDECVAMGGYFETYYTGLKPEQKKEWLKWLNIYRDEQIYKGEYLNLYDIANDVPEFHVTRRNDNLYYFAPGSFKGKVELRGLDKASYTLTDFSTNEIIANIEGPIARVEINAENNIYLKAAKSVN
jgi:alpha-galactosidase